MPYGLYVFDLDGTLVNSRRDLADAANELVMECGGAPLDEERIGRMVGEGAARLVARVFEASGLPQPADALARYLAIYEGRLLNHTRVYQGMADVLDALGRRAQLAVLTNKPVAPTRRILAGLDLAHYFPESAVIGGDGPFPRKPDASGLRHLSAQAGVPVSTTLLVGDSAIDLQTARNAGAAICLAEYGFGFGTVPRTAVSSAEVTIRAPRELLFNV